MGGLWIFDTTVWNHKRKVCVRKEGALGYICMSNQVEDKV